MDNQYNTSIKLMTHVVVGYPSLEKTVEIVKAMVSAGADMVELQIPFSDPLADGPTIMRACEKALKNGIKVRDSFSVMATLSKDVSVPLYFMAYYNTVFRYGGEKFCRNAKEAGATGLIVPDIPIEEEYQEHFFAFCRKSELENIRVVSPASTDERLQKNAKVATGFVYATARQGITGARNVLDTGTKAFLQRVRKYVTLPIACGFGISQPDQIQALQGNADITVVGSAIIDVINRSSEEEMIEHITQYIAGLR